MKTTKFNNDIELSRFFCHKFYSINGFNSTLLKKN